MKTKNSSSSQKELSFIEKARRAQIVEYAIETLAEVGYSQASLGQIAKRAKISKGVISYHFTNKEELLEQVVTEYFLARESFIRPQLERLQKIGFGHILKPIWSLSIRIGSMYSRLLRLYRIREQMMESFGMRKTRMGRFTFPLKTFSISARKRGFFESFLPFQQK